MTDDRILRNRPVDRAFTMAYQALRVSPEDAFTPAQVAEIIESGELPHIIERARETVTAARNYRHWLESLTADDGAAPRVCPVCGAPVRGRTDRRYCSDTCRQKGHRASRLQS